MKLFFYNILNFQVILKLLIGLNRDTVGMILIDLLNDLVNGPQVYKVMHKCTKMQLLLGLKSLLHFQKKTKLGMYVCVCVCYTMSYPFYKHYAYACRHIQTL